MEVYNNIIIIKRNSWLKYNGTIPQTTEDRLLEESWEVFGFTAEEAHMKFKDLRSSHSLGRIQDNLLGSGAYALKKAPEFAPFEWLFPYINNQ